MWLQAGIPDAITEHAFALADQLGNTDAHLFPAAPGCDARRAALRELHQLVLVVAKSGGDGADDSQIEAAAARAQKCIADLDAAAT